MYTKVIRTTEEFKELKESWKELQGKSSKLTYYNTFDYLYNYWDVYKNDKNLELFIICIYENNELICISPFVIRNKKKMFLKWRTLEFLGRADYLNFIHIDKKKIVQSAIKEVFKTVKEEIIDRITLTHIKADSELASYFLKSPEFNNSFRYLIECPIFYSSKYENINQYINENFKPSDIKYFVNKLKRDEDYSFKIVTGEKIFEKIVQLHKYEKEYLIENKMKNDRRCLFEDIKRNNFIFNTYKNNKNAITFLLENKEKHMLIYYTCYLYNGTLYFWNTAYNPRYAKYDLTKVLNYEVFKYIYENELNWNFDYGAGRYTWKFRWTSDFKFLYKLDLWTVKDNKILKRLIDIKKCISK